MTQTEALMPEFETDRYADEHDAALRVEPDDNLAPRKKTDLDQPNSAEREPPSGPMEAETVADEVRSEAFETFFESEVGQKLLRVAKDKEAFDTFAATVLKVDPAKTENTEQVRQALIAVSDGDFSAMPDILAVKNAEGFVAYAAQMEVILLDELLLLEREAAERDLLAHMANNQQGPAFSLETAIGREIGHWMSQKINGTDDQKTEDGRAFDEGDAVFKALGGNVAQSEILSDDHETISLSLDGAPAKTVMVERFDPAAATPSAKVAPPRINAQLTKTTEHRDNIGHNENEIFPDGEAYFKDGKKRRDKNYRTARDKDVHLELSTFSSLNTGQVGQTVLEFNGDAKIEYTESRYKHAIRQKTRRDRTAERSVEIGGYEWGSDLTADQRELAEKYFYLNSETGQVTQIADIDYTDPAFQNIKLSVDVTLKEGAKGNVSITLNAEGALADLTSRSETAGDVPVYRTDNLPRENMGDVSGNTSGHTVHIVDTVPTVTASLSGGFRGFRLARSKTVDASLVVTGDLSIEDESGGDFVGALSMTYRDVGKNYDDDNVREGPVENERFEIKNVIATHRTTGETVDLTDQFEIGLGNSLKLKDGLWIELSPGEGLSDYDINAQVTGRGEVGYYNELVDDWDWEKHYYTTEPTTFNIAIATTDKTKSAYEDSTVGLVLEGTRSTGLADSSGTLFQFQVGGRTVTLSEDSLQQYNANVGQQTYSVAMDRDALIGHGYSGPQADIIIETSLAYQLAGVAPGFLDPEKAGLPSLQEAFLPEGDENARAAYKSLTQDINQRALVTTFGSDTDPTEIANDLVESYMSGAIGNNIQANLVARLQQAEAEGDTTFTKGSPAYEAYRAELTQQFVGIVMGFDKDVGAEIAAFIPFDDAITSISETATTYGTTFAGFDITDPIDRNTAGQALSATLQMHDNANGGDTLHAALADDLQALGIDASDPEAVSTFLSQPGNANLLIETTLTGFFGDATLAESALAGRDLTDIGSFDELVSETYDIVGEFVVDQVQANPAEVANFVLYDAWGDRAPTSKGSDTSYGLFVALGGGTWKKGFESSDLVTSVAHVTASVELLDDVSGDGTVAAALDGDEAAITALNVGLAFISRFSLVENGYYESNDLFGETGWFDVAARQSPDLVSGTDKDGYHYLDANGATDLYLEAFGLSDDIIGAWQNGTLSGADAAVIGDAIETDGFSVGQTVIGEDGSQIVVTQDMVAHYQNAEARGAGQGVARLTGLTYDNVLGSGHGFVDTGLTIAEEETQRIALTERYGEGFDASEVILVTDDQGLETLSQVESQAALSALNKTQSGEAPLVAGDVLNIEEDVPVAGQLTREEAQEVLIHITDNPDVAAGGEIYLESGETVRLSQAHLDAVTFQEGEDDEGTLETLQELRTYYVRHVSRKVRVTAPMLAQHGDHVARAPEAMDIDGAAPQQADAPKGGRLAVRPPLTAEETQILDDVKKQADAGGEIRINSADISPDHSSSLYDLQSFPPGDYAIIETATTPDGQPIETRIKLREFTREDGTKGVRITEVEYTSGYNGTTHWKSPRKKRKVTQDYWRANNDIVQISGNAGKTDLYASFDDAGHLRRDKFGGGVHAFNLVAQDSYTNQKDRGIGSTTIGTDGKPVHTDANWRNWEGAVEKFFKKYKGAELKITIGLDFTDADTRGNFQARPDAMNLNVEAVTIPPELLSDPDFIKDLENLQGYKIIDNKFLSPEAFKKLKKDLRVGDDARQKFLDGTYDPAGNKQLSIIEKPSDRATGANVTPTATFFDTEHEEIFGTDPKDLGLRPQLDAIFEEDLKTTDGKNNPKDHNLILVADNPPTGQPPKIELHVTLEGDYYFKVDAYVVPGGLQALPENFKKYVQESGVAVVFKNTVIAPSPSEKSDVPIELDLTSDRGKLYGEFGLSQEKFQSVFGDASEGDFAKFRRNYNKADVNRQAYWRERITNADTVRLDIFEENKSVTTLMNTQYNDHLGLKTSVVDKTERLTGEALGIIFKKPDDTGPKIVFVPNDNETRVQGDNYFIAADQVNKNTGRISGKALVDLAISEAREKGGLQALTVDDLFRKAVKRGGGAEDFAHFWVTNEFKIRNQAETKLRPVFGQYGVSASDIFPEGKNEFTSFQKTSFAEAEFAKGLAIYKAADLTPYQQEAQVDDLQERPSKRRRTRNRSIGGADVANGPSSSRTWNIFRDSIGADDFLLAREKVAAAFAPQGDFSKALDVDAPPAKRFNAVLDGIGAGSQGVGKLLASAVPFVDIGLTAWSTAEAFKTGDRTDKTLAILDVVAVGLDVVAIGLATYGAGAAAGTAWATVAAAAGPIGAIAFGITAAVIIAQIIKGRRERKKLENLPRAAVQFLLDPTGSEQSSLDFFGGDNVTYDPTMTSKASVDSSGRLTYGPNSEDAIVELFFEAVQSGGANGTAWMVNLYNTFDFLTESIDSY